MLRQEKGQKSRKRHRRSVDRPLHLDDANAKSRNQRVRDQPVLDELIEERARLSAERDFYRAQCQCVARAATLPWPKPASARWGFDRDLVVAHLRQELANIDAALSASLRRVLLCCLIVWCRHAIPTYEHFKRLFNERTLGGNLLLKRGPAILVDFDEKSAEISSLPRFRRVWRRAARGARKHTRIVRFGGFGERVAVLTHPKVRQKEEAAKAKDVPTPSSIWIGNAYIEMPADSSCIERPSKKPRFETYKTIHEAIEAAGGNERVSFDARPGDIQKIVGDASEYVLCPIQQIWPCITERQLRSLLYELDHKRPI